MHFRYERLWGSLSEATVAEFERAHQLKLPEDYRSYLLDHHGGVPEPNFYWVIPGDWGSGIANMYGFRPGAYQLETYYAGRRSLGIPDDLLPIGDDGCCNYLCIGLTGDRAGGIYFVDCEFESGQPGQVRHLSKTFSDFLGQLSDQPDH